MDKNYWILCEVTHQGIVFNVQIPGFGVGSPAEVKRASVKFAQQIGATYCKPLVVIFEQKKEN